MAPHTTSWPSSDMLKAMYKSPTGEKAFSHSLTTGRVLDQFPETNEQIQFSKAKTAYLSELRSSIKGMQGDINVFLTAKMAEDQKNPTTNGAQTNSKGKDEIEEDKYGEEVVEEEDE